DHYLAVLAILVDGKGEKYLPQIKRVFQTLRPTPPEVNTKLAAALAGRSFGHSEIIPDSGSFTTLYDFRADGSVRKQILVSGGDVGGSTDENGTFEVVGDEVFLYFGDGQASGSVVTEAGA